jgi:hypothetical protein
MTAARVGLILALLIASTVRAQSCPAACQPESNGKQGPNTPTVSIGFAPGFSASDIAAMRNGIEMWNDVFLQTWTDLWFTTAATGSPQITIVPDPNLPGGGENDTDTYGNGEISIATAHLNRNQNALLAHIVAHELGHSLGYANNSGVFSGGSCQSRTIMFGAISLNGPFMSSIGTCDSQAVSNDYPTNQPPPPPADEIQHNGSPIVLSLESSGYRLTSIDEGVQFDLDADGLATQMAWTRAGVENAFLALDRNQNGRVDNGAELFGNFTPLDAGGLARNGFEALRELDGNADGAIDRNDAAWWILILWTDRNHDGRSTPKELKLLSRSSVVALGLDYRRSGKKDRWGNEYRYKARFRMRRGTTEMERTYYDIFFVLQ